MNNIKYCEIHGHVEFVENRKKESEKCIECINDELNEEYRKMVQKEKLKNFENFMGE